MTKIIAETRTHQTDRYRWYVALERKVEDAWVGVFWERLRGAAPVLNLWVTIIPCFPVHVFIQRRAPEPRWPKR